MQNIVRLRVLLFVLSIIIVSAGTYAVVLFARGYRPDFSNQRLDPTGILFATSLPNGAQVEINSQMRTVTDNSLNLPPGTYDVEIKKDGYSSWKKQLQIEAEAVTKITAFLFPTIPSLKAITSTGAYSPTISPEGNKIVYTTKEGSLAKIYILELNDSALGLLNREAKQVFSSPDYNFNQYNFVWSPDSRQILAVASPSAYLLDLSTQALTNVSSHLETLISSWESARHLLQQQQFSTLPPTIQATFATSSSHLLWSPKEDKVLYVATASATLPDKAVRPLPGSSTQPQTRQIEPGGVYVYDLEEDRNFFITQVQLPTPTPKPKKPVVTPAATTVGVSTASNISSRLGYTHPSNLTWFPTSVHLLHVTNDKITITEYDNQNPTVVYAGPMESGVAIPYPSAKQLLILTNLTPSISSQNNLYAISLR